MSKRTKYTAEEKYEVIKACEDETRSLSEIASMYKIDRATLRAWKYNFEKYGLDGLKESTTWKVYTSELKDQAVKDYLSGKYSATEIVKKYEISNRYVLSTWINKYNCHRETTEIAKGMGQSMTKGRSTSWKERIEIAQYCIAHNNDYKHAAEVNHVSYQQVYQWVKKYESGGEDALHDKRGKKKIQEELTPEDRMKLEFKKLEAENERLRAENEFLKKLDELERGRY